MIEDVKKIALRNAEEIDKEIAALEQEIDSDVACAKKSYLANCIRLDIARLKRDIQIIACAQLKYSEVFDKMDILIDELIESKYRLTNLESLVSYLTKK